MAVVSESNFQSVAGHNAGRMGLKSVQQMAVWWASLMERMTAGLMGWATPMAVQMEKERPKAMSSENEQKALMTGPA